MAEKSLSQVCVVLGSQWGDEGKGKIVDVLSQQYDICARYNGGSNAGHTIVVDNVKYAFHLMPSGILNPKGECLIGNGVVVHLPTLKKELDHLTDNKVNYQGRLFISDRAHLVFDLHQAIDGLREKELETSGSQLGTTKRGIGPTYCDKASRVGIRAGDLLNWPEFVKKFENLVNTSKAKYPTLKVDEKAEIEKYQELVKTFAPMIVDGVFWLNNSINKGKKVMLEGANAAMLDLDFGTYPYVTSSNPTIGGCITGLGIPATKIKDVIGVVKAYTTRVGEGPFPTHLTDDTGNFLTEKGHEYGTTTGRRRKCGWLDLFVVKYTNMINGYTAINLTKLDILSGLNEVKIAVGYKYQGKELDSMPASLDVLSKVEVIYETLPGWKEDISKCTSWDQLPANCKKYVERIEEILKVPIKWIGNGPARDALIEKP